MKGKTISTAYYEPFWAHNEGFKGGRDPLGIENSSITVYGLLLPGLTNLTGRLRYYSIYCWLLKAFDKQEREGKNNIHQYNFIRRAELTLAYIMKPFPNITNVIGRDYVSKEDDKDEYNIAQGADLAKGGKGKYWTFKTGAFGQYYLGSLVYLKLVTVHKQSFYLLERGRNLANAFEECVDSATLNLFLSIINNGIMQMNDIKTLEPLCLNKICQGSKEWMFLHNMLTSDDEESQYRKGTINIFLNELKEPTNYKQLPELMYLKNSRDISSTSYGWRYYYLCECMHFSVETVFWMLLKEAESAINEPYILFKNRCQQAIEKEFAEFRDLTLSDCIDYISSENSLTNCRKMMEDRSKKDKHIEATKAAINTLFVLYHLFEREQKSIEEFEIRHNLTRQNGIISSFLRLIFGHTNERSIAFFIEKLIDITLNAHITAALRKMGSSDANLLKFLIEDGRIIHIDTRKPQFTTPRLSSLYNFLIDLNVLQNKNNDSY